MSRSQTSYFITDPVVRSLSFGPLPGAGRDITIFNTNCIETVVPQARFLLGQSKILGFKRDVSSPNPADNGTPYIVNFAVDVAVPSPVIPVGATSIQVYNPFRNNTIVLRSSSNSDTSRYTMYWVNEYANPEVAQSLGLVSQAVFPNP